MWALVENNAVTRVYMRPTEITTLDYVPATYYGETILWAEGDELPEGVTVGNVKHFVGDIKTEQVGSIYSRDVFTTYTTEQLEAIGIYEVVVDNTNFQDKEFYINTDQSFDFADGVVTASYGVATPKVLDDVLYTAQDETDGFGIEGEIKQYGIRQPYIKGINITAGNILQPTDWMVIREAEGGTAVPSEITTQRAAVRTKANEMCTAIENASDLDALITLLTYVNTGTMENPVMARPLGELPEVN